MGYIYVIENDINDKVYVGQTKRAPQGRFMQHIKDSIHGDTNKLHTAMREIAVRKIVAGWGKGDRHSQKYDRVPSTVIAWKHKYGIM